MAKTPKPRREMTRKEVLDVRLLWDSGYSIDFIAKRYRRHRDTISDVVHNKTHKRVKPLKKLPDLPATLLEVIEEEQAALQPKYSRLREAMREQGGADRGSTGDS